MNNKMKQRYSQVANDLQLHFDQEKDTIFGEAKGYLISLSPFTTNGQMILYVSVSCFGTVPEMTDMKEIRKSSKYIINQTIQGYKVGFILRISNKDYVMTEQLKEVLNVIGDGLERGKYENCCQTCGGVKPTEVCLVSGQNMLLCDDCFLKVSNDLDAKAQTLVQKKENIIGGIVGALLGSCLGVAVIVIIGQLGYISVISGVIMAICTLMGYKLLGGKLSTVGIVISCVIIVGMIYLGNQLDWTVSIMRYFEVDFFDAFQAVSEFLKEGYIDGGVYYRNLAMLYVFALLGAVPTIWGSVKNKQIANITGKMQDNR